MLSIMLPNPEDTVLLMSLYYKSNIISNLGGYNVVRKGCCDRVRNPIFACQSLFTRVAVE